MVQGLMLGILFGAPWLAAIAWFWPRQVRDSVATPSPGELALRRLSG